MTPHQSAFLIGMLTGGACAFAGVVIGALSTLRLKPVAKTT